MKISLAILAGTLFAINTAHALDLDAPVQKKITTKTEIIRGHDSAFNCVMHSETEPIPYSKCLDNAESENVQVNTNTDPYLLGLYFSAWEDFAIMVESYQDSPDKAAYATRNARFYLTAARQLERKLGIDDMAVINVTNLNYKSIKPRLDQWNKIILTAQPDNPK